MITDKNHNIVNIDLTNHPPNAKLGMLLAPGALPTAFSTTPRSNNSLHNAASAAHHHSSSLPTSSKVTLVAGWEHGTNQQLGPIQRSGMVRLGDRLVRINGRDVTDWTFREVMDALKEIITSSSTLETNNNSNNNSNNNGKRKSRLKTLGFAPSGTEEWSRGVGEDFNANSLSFGLLFQQQSMSSQESPHVISKRLYSFVSFIGRWRVVMESPQVVAVSATTTTTTTFTAGKASKQQQEEKEQQHQQQEQQRQISENSTDLLEEQLNKEPSIKFDDDGPIDAPDDDDHDDDNKKNNNQDCNNEDHEQPPNRSAAGTTATANQKEDQATPSIFSPEAEAEWKKEIFEFQETLPQKKIVQYEIQCHLLLRDPSYHNNNSNNKSKNYNNKIDKNGNRRNNNTINHSWSVWKRYSEFKSLDTELRKTFGWQMDAVDDARGIVFPSVHGLESWWYGWRNGGGYLTSLMGGSYGVDLSNNTTDAAVAAVLDDNVDLMKRDEKKENGDKSGGDNSTCPYPESFIEKRQKELASYWTSLSRVEDIFEFSDINSHRFGRLMASFLEVDRVLLSKRNSSRAATATAAAAASTISSSSSANQQRHRHQQTLSPSPRLTGIHENETTELFSFSAKKSENWQSPLTPTREISGLSFNDDDVSILSDGTGAANAYLTSLQNNHSPILQVTRQRLVDGVPTQFAPKDTLLAENRSVSSNSTKRIGGRASRRTKPAFQRQNLD
jgi:hypothetical protein